MGLGGAGGPAAAVPACSAAQENHHIPGGRPLPPDVGGRGSGDHRADLHALGGIAGVVELVHLAGGQADLVAIGGVPRSRLGDDGPLGELTGHGLLNGGEGLAAPVRRMAE